MAKDFFSRYNLKETVSRELRWVMLYINQKLFVWAIGAHPKILILSEGYLLCKLKKKKHMNGPSILDGVDDSM